MIVSRYCFGSALTVAVMLSGCAGLNHVGGTTASSGPLPLKQGQTEGVDGESVVHETFKPKTHNLPPAEMLMQPGPGVGGPGPGVINPMPPIGVAPAPLPTAQVLFNSPDTMEIRYDARGYGYFDSTPMVTPARNNFSLGGLYRLKLTNIPGRAGVELYPTLEITPPTPRTGAYLAHNAIPIQFTDEDFDQVLAGNFVTKVIYLPDPEFQELALANVATLVSTRLDPGVDPIVEADRRGAILAIIRVGNKDMEMPGMNPGFPPPGYGADPSMAYRPSAGGSGMGGDVDPYYAAQGGYGGEACPPYGQPYGGGVMPGQGGPGGQYIAGVTAPTYGIPITGTPIGLPGPPHIPFGVPAGLQQHSITNHTHQHIPGPSPTVQMHVKQTPGLSYPQPADRVYVRESTVRPAIRFNQPETDKVHVYGTTPYAGAYGEGGMIGGSSVEGGEYCPPGQ